MYKAKKPVVKKAMEHFSKPSGKKVMGKNKKAFTKGAMKVGY